MRKILEKFLSVPEKLMNVRFINRLNLFERIVLAFFIYLYIAVEIPIILVSEGAKYVKKGFKWLVCKCAAIKNNVANSDFVHRQKANNWNGLRTASIVMAVLCSISLFIGLYHVRKVQRAEQIAKVESALETVTFEYVVAGKDSGEYYTWIAIAEDFCPSYMHVAVSSRNPKCNYLSLLYHFNDGWHELQDGEVVKVPILE